MTHFSRIPRDPDPILSVKGASGDAGVSIIGRGDSSIFAGGSVAGGSDEIKKPKEQKPEEPQLAYASVFSTKPPVGGDASAVSGRGGTFNAIG